MKTIQLLVTSLLVVTFLNKNWSEIGTAMEELEHNRNWKV